MPDKSSKKPPAESPTEKKSTPPAGRSDDPLAPLRVIDRLEVGPVRVEPHRIVAPYTVFQNGRSDSTEFAYRYEEKVLDPADPGAVNLASMAAAQLALNYGLFCDEIVFHGKYDEADRQFLVEMAKNTAREIYVKKFQEPNPFLHGPAASLPTVKLDHYLHARLEFPDSAAGKPGATPTNGNRWTVDRSRHMILSSGGKDSLLSFGLLTELGRETHPVFVNESGKHWFTALNAYRHFSANHSLTGRVWTNADRVFAWMLRHLPFVRTDFLNVRSDEYPVRLWTVAIFIFGVLPVARFRGAGRLIIGDEYDTTDRRTHEGIPHYNGLYDQSRYFDNAMTRYYMRKGWGVSQFSLLRPLSEMLIEKILVERYPDLLRLQVSCHAAHVEGPSVRPCGRCEKCRRIASMLTGLGADPGMCGYSPEQVEKCLKSFSEEGVHQESDGAEHLAHVLIEKGLMSRLSPLGKVARPRPHVLQIRFHPEQSPEDAIPPDLRGPLHRIFLEHAHGAVARQGRMWTNFDPLSDAALAKPYPLEAPQGEPKGRETDSRPQRKGHRDYMLGELTWPEAQARFKKVDVALLPVGAIEQHGPHLPLDVDAFDAGYLAERVAASCRDPKPFVLPLIPYGVSYHHDDFSGTISISNDTLARLVYEVGMSIARNGITKLIIINGHGGNAPSLHFAAQMINRDAHIFTCVDTGETSDADVARLAETARDIHAGEIETSTTMAVRPEMVRVSKARKYVPRFSSRYLDFSSTRGVDWYAHTSKLSRTGVMGDPTKANPEKGERMWAVMIRNLVELTEHLQAMSLDEIYQHNAF